MFYTTAGPNGSEDWLNCGINDAGWRPPNVTLGEIVTVNLSTALLSPSSPFHACSSFLDLFDEYAKKYDIPAIILASFSMQESSCNPDAVGEGGEQGLMQISRDKCGDLSDEECRDPVRRRFCRY